MRRIDRAQKLALLQALLKGTATDGQIDVLRKSREPIRVTLIIDEENEPQETPDPQYCISVHEDGTTHCYDRYTDGHIVTRYS